MNSTDKLIINAAITGCVFTKSDTKSLPVTLGEIVVCAQRLRDVGASIIHLHARHKDQSPSFEASAYEELVNGVREACGDVITCVSLSGPSSVRPLEACGGPGVAA